MAKPLCTTSNLADSRRQFKQNLCRNLKAQDEEFPHDLIRLARSKINLAMLDKINADEFSLRVAKIAKDIPLTPTALRSAAIAYISEAMRYMRCGPHDCWFIDALSQADVDALVTVLLEGGSRWEV